jgi:hypothetical protein
MKTTLQYHGDTYTQINRIITDGGLVTSTSYLNKAVNNSILINKPNYMPMISYKTGKIYSNLLNGNLDFTFTRNSQKVVPLDYKGGVNTIISNNTPSIDYSFGTPTLLVEPSRTNLFLNSDVLSNQTVSITSGTYQISFYGSGTITGTRGATVDFTITGSNDTTRTVHTFVTGISGSRTITVTGTVTKACLERGKFVTSYIKSTSTQGTRAQENLTLNNLYTNGFVTSAGGT